MKHNLIFRLTLSGFVMLMGILIAGLIIPRELIFSSGIIIILVAAVAFGVLGFILPELLALAAKAGVEEVAKQIVRKFPGSAADFASFASPLRFRRRKSKSRGFVNPIMVDTSVLVDGRLGDIAKSGFITGTLIILPSVIEELHFLSDSSDDLKRARGRRGLDILEAIRTDKKVKSEVLDWEPKDSKVDNKLITAAKKLKASLMTVDFNLVKVAKVRGIKVMNINELANAVRIVTLPGEEFRVTINAAGKGKDQGVGFLDDGTMIVVENGAAYVGREIKVKVNKVLQTAAGKMIFAKSTV